MAVTPTAMKASAQAQTSIVWMKNSPSTAGTRVSVRPMACWKIGQWATAWTMTRDRTISPMV